MAGELLIAHVRQTLREQKLLHARFVDLQGRRRGLVPIATIAGVVPSVMPAPAGWIQAHHPFVKLVVRAMALDAVVHAVVAGEAGLGLGDQLPADPKLRVLARVPSRVGAVMVPDHPLAGRPDLSLADCFGYPMVIPDPTISIGVQELRLVRAAHAGWMRRGAERLRRLAICPRLAAERIVATDGVQLADQRSA